MTRDVIISIFCLQVSATESLFKCEPGLHSCENGQNEEIRFIFHSMPRCAHKHDMAFYKKFTKITSVPFISELLLQ